MNRNEDLTVHPNGPERPLRDEELDAVSGGTIRALGGPDTRQQSDHSCWIRVSHPYAGA